MSVGTLDAFLGHAIHRPASDSMARLQCVEALLELGRSVVKNTTTSDLPRSCVFSSTPSISVAKSIGRVDGSRHASRP